MASVCVFLQSKNFTDWCAVRWIFEWIEWVILYVLPTWQPLVVSSKFLNDSAHLKRLLALIFIFIFLHRAYRSIRGRPPCPLTFVGLGRNVLTWKECLTHGYAPGHCFCSFHIEEGETNVLVKFKFSIMDVERLKILLQLILISLIYFRTLLFFHLVPNDILDLLFLKECNASTSFRSIVIFLIFTREFEYQVEEKQIHVHRKHILSNVKANPRYSKFPIQILVPWINQFALRISELCWSNTK